MDNIDSLLPGLSEFLQCTLSGEKLSFTAEEKRQSLVQRLEVLTQPPTLPPRPPDLPEPANSEDFIRQQREWSRVNAPLPRMNGGEELYEEFSGDIEGNETTGTQGNAEEAPPGKGEEEEEDVDGFYEEPCLTDDILALSDSGSVTSYESYTDGEFDDGPDYENQGYPNRGLTPAEEIQLPRSDWKRVKTKKKKKKQSDEETVCARRLPGVTYRGELSQRGFLSLTRLYCVIRDNVLICFKSEKETRAVARILLLGYDVVYLERDGKYSHALRISHPGCATHMFYSDSRDSAEQWLEHMVAATCGQEVAGGSEDGSVGSSSCDNPNNPASAPVSRTGSFRSNHSNGRTATPPPQCGDEIGSVSEDAASATSSNDAYKRSKGFTLGNIFSLSRKRGEKVKRILSEPAAAADNVEVGPDTVIAGWLNVMDGGGKKWSRRWVTVSHNTIECFKEAGEEPHEVCMSLSGVQLETAAKETKRDLAIKLSSQDNQKLYLEPGDPLEQGHWLKVLITEAGSPPPQSQETMPPADTMAISMDTAPTDKPPTKGTPPPLPKTAPPIGRRRQKSVDTDLESIMETAAPGLETLCPEEQTYDNVDTPCASPSTAKPPHSDPPDPPAPILQQQNSEYYSYANHNEMENETKEGDDCEELYDDVEVNFMAHNTQRQSTEVNNNNSTEDNADDDDGKLQYQGERYLEMSSPQVVTPLKQNPLPGTKQPEDDDSDNLYIEPSSPFSGENSDSEEISEYRRVKVDIFGKVIPDEPPKSTMRKGKQRASLFSEGTFVVRTGQMHMDETKKTYDWSAAGQEWPESVESQVDDTFKAIKAKMDKEDGEPDKKEEKVKRPSPSTRTSVKENKWTKSNNSNGTTNNNSSSNRNSSSSSNNSTTRSNSNKSSNSNSGDSKPSVTSSNLGAAKAEESDVVKCHSGPTILEDEALLKTHANPILSELRKEKHKPSWSESELDKLIENISTMKRKVASIKRKRAQVRGQKLRATKDEERKKFEDELGELDKELESSETELTKIQLVAQEKESQLQRGGGNRPSSYPRHGSSPTTSPLPRSSLNQTGQHSRSGSSLGHQPSLSASSSASSVGSVKNSGKKTWQKTTENSTRTNAKTGSTSSSNTKPGTVKTSRVVTKSLSTPTTRSNGVSKPGAATKASNSSQMGNSAGSRSTLHTTSVRTQQVVSSAQRSTLPAGLGSGNDKSNKDTARSYISSTLISVNTSPKGTRITATSTKTGASQKMAARGGSGGTVSSTTSPRNGSPQGGGGDAEKTGEDSGKGDKKIVQERLKLWETMGKSTC